MSAFTKRGTSLRRIEAPRVDEHPRPAGAQPGDPRPDERRPDELQPDDLEPDDAPLMARIAAGDLGALGVLYDRHHADVRHFAERAAPGGRDADDLVHEVFLTLPRAARSFDARRSARPFLIGITAQLLRRRRRSFARLTAALKRFRLEWSESPSTPEEQLSGSEDRLRFERALEAISEEKRLVFLLVESEGMSGEEVARALDIPVATVWTRLHYARRDLRARMTKRGRP